MSNHNFVCVSPSMYDSIYECTKCKFRYMCSIDDPTKREFPPCTVEYSNTFKQSPENIKDAIRNRVKDMVGKPLTDDLIEKLIGEAEEYFRNMIQKKSPLCWVDNHDLDKLKQGKGATVYGQADFNKFSLHHYKPLHLLSEE